MILEGLPETVTRIEVVDHRRDTKTRGRVVVAYGVTGTLSLQDEGRTLKVLINDHPTVTAEEVHQAIRDGLAAWAAEVGVELRAAAVVRAEADPHR